MRASKACASAPLLLLSEPLRPRDAGTERLPVCRLRRARVGVGVRARVGVGVWVWVGVGVGVGVSCRSAPPCVAELARERACYHELYGRGELAVLLLVRVRRVRVKG